jgi:hypothetical protein
MILSSPTSNPGRRRAIVAEFHKDSGSRMTLFAMTVLADGHGSDGRAYRFREQYDVELSKKYGYIFHTTGFGGDHVIPASGIYHVSGDVKVKQRPCQLVDGHDKPPWRSKKTRAIRERNKTRRLRNLPKAFGVEPGKDLLDWLHRNAIQEHAVYCSECRDWMPHTGYDFCKHVWWCDKTGSHSTPTERCKCKSQEECRDG